MTPGNIAARRSLNALHHRPRPSATLRDGGRDGHGDGAASLGGASLGKGPISGKCSRCRHVDHAAEPVVTINGATVNALKRRALSGLKTAAKDHAVRVQPSSCETRKMKQPAKAPTIVPFMRIYWRSLPTTSSRRSTRVRLSQLLTTSATNALISCRHEII